MRERLLHTPEGVRDIYGMEYARKLKIEETLRRQCKAYGYRDIQTPTFEFFDVFSREIGTTPSRELYKFFDKEGNTLVLRPDFTPSMARCAAKYFTEEEMPIRFLYSGNTFTNTSNLQGKLKEMTEMGVELIGEPSVEADGEVVSLIVQTLLSAGLKDFQVGVGQVEYFKGICESVGLTEELEEELREAISNKNYFGAENLLLESCADEKSREVLLKLTDLFGGAEVLLEAQALATNEKSRAAVKRLKALYGVLQAYGVEQYVSFDFGMLSKYNYYTGVIFKAYTYGIGDVIVKGGRYDNLLGRFGKQAAAVGFVIVVDDLMEALARQRIPVPVLRDVTLLVYTQDAYPEALAQAKAYRQIGKNVELLPAAGGRSRADYEAYAAENAYETVNILGSL